MFERVLEDPKEERMSDEKAARFRKKPVVIDAVRLIGGNDEGAFEVFAAQFPEFRFEVFDDHILIPTLEGDMRADVGDWIIRGVAGEFYPCKPDIFVAAYEPVSGVGEGK